MSDGSTDDWETRLTGQGVTEEQIAAAKLAAKKMADALASFTFSPCRPIAPSEFAAILSQASPDKDQA